MNAFLIAIMMAAAAAVGGVDATVAVVKNPPPPCPVIAGYSVQPTLGVWRSDIGYPVHRITAQNAANRCDVTRGCVALTWKSDISTAWLKTAWGPTYVIGATACFYVKLTALQNTAVPPPPSPMPPVPPRAPAVSKCTAVAGYVVFPALDVWGSDILSNPRNYVDKVSPKDACALCDSTPGCVALTWKYDISTAWLKNSTDNAYVFGEVACFYVRGVAAP
jgi:hypothetical protein